MVDAYLIDASERQLQGIAQKLASLEFGAFTNAHGMTEIDPAARCDFGDAPTRDDLRDHADRKAMLEAIPDFSSPPWLETIQRVAALPTLDPIDWAIVTIAFENNITQPIDPALYQAIGRAFLDRFCAACAPKVDPGRMRVMPSPVLVARSSAPGASPPPVADGPARAVTTIAQAFEAWAAFQTREPKLVDEWRTAIERFVRLHDDPPVDAITASMVRAYRRTYAGLPGRVGQKIAALPLLEQVEVAKAQGLKPLAPATVNKALSAIRVTLDHAVEELEIISVNVAKSVTSLPKNEIEDPRLPFEPQDMVRIFGSPISEGTGITARTLFWTLLLAPFTGCRLDELGKLRPSNIKTFGGIADLSIEPDRMRVREEQGGIAKRVKTASAKRDIPLHPILISAGVLDMVANRLDEGAEWLFTEFAMNKYGSRTQRFSRVMNDFLDKIGLSDPELVFYSFRRTGKRAIRGKAIKEIVHLLFGHADGSVSTQYGRGADMAVLQETIEKITYPDVRWDLVIERAKSILLSIRRARLRSFSQASPIDRDRQALCSNVLSPYPRRLLPRQRHLLDLVQGIYRKLRRYCGTGSKFGGVFLCDSAGYCECSRTKDGQGSAVFGF